VADPSPAPALGAGLSLPDAGEARIYRQLLPAGRRPIQVLNGVSWLCAAVLAIAAWQLVAVHGRVDGSFVLVCAILVAPTVGLGILTNMGARGRLRDWWWPRRFIQVDDKGVAWWTDGTARQRGDSIEWAAVAAVGPTLPSRHRPPGMDCALSAPDGRILARLPCRLERIDRPARESWRRVVWLPDVAVAIRPDRYRRRRMLGRRATLRDPGSG
jgi:hypothetical protein